MTVEIKEKEKDRDKEKVKTKSNEVVPSSFETIANHPQRTSNTSKLQSSAQLSAVVSEPALEASTFKILPMLNNNKDDDHHGITDGSPNETGMNSTATTSLISSPAQELSNPMLSQPLRSKKTPLIDDTLMQSSDQLHQKDSSTIQHSNDLDTKLKNKLNPTSNLNSTSSINLPNSSISQRNISISSVITPTASHLNLSNPQTQSTTNNNTSNATIALPNSTIHSTPLNGNSHNNNDSIHGNNQGLTNLGSTMTNTSNANIVPSGGNNINNLTVNTITSNNSQLNNNTVTSLASLTSRAEHFAAKIHSAIKEDEKTSDSDESFVYETTSKPNNTTVINNGNSSNGNTASSTNNTTNSNNANPNYPHSVHTTSPLAQPVVSEINQAETSSAISILNNSTSTSTDPYKEDSTSAIGISNHSPGLQSRYPVGSNNSNSNTSTVINPTNTTTTSTTLDNFGSSNSQSDFFNVSSTNNNTPSKPVLRSNKSNYGITESIDDGSNSYYDGKSSSRRLSRTTFSIDPLTSTQQAQQPQQQQTVNSSPENVHSTTASISNANTGSTNQTTTHTSATNTHNPLRQITSKLFDSRGTGSISGQQSNGPIAGTTMSSKYNNILDATDFSVDDFDDDDFDESGLVGFNQYQYYHPQHHNSHNQQHSRTLQNQGQALESIPSEVEFRNEYDYSMNEPLLKGKLGYNSIGAYGTGTGNTGAGLIGTGSPNANNNYFNSYGSTNNGQSDQFASYGSNQYNTINNSLANNSYGNPYQSPLSPQQQRLLRSNKQRQELYFSPHNFTSARAKRLKQLKNFCYTISLIILLVSVGFISGFILATTKELQRSRIEEINEILISQEELVFNMAVESFNPGFLSIAIQDVDIDIFARSKHVDDGEEEMSSDLTTYESENSKDTEDGSDSKLSTVLLGSVTHLDIPLIFQGGFFTRDEGISVTEIKVLNPCSKPNTGNDTSLLELSGVSETEADSDPEDSTGKKQWLAISQHKFDLIIRGSLSYQLPISASNRTLGINKVFPIDPNNLPKHGEGIHGDDDDGFYYIGHDPDFSNGKGKHHKGAKHDKGSGRWIDFLFGGSYRHSGTNHYVHQIDRVH